MSSELPGNKLIITPEWHFLHNIIYSVASRHRRYENKPLHVISFLLLVSWNWLISGMERVSTATFSPSSFLSCSVLIVSWKRIWMLSLLTESVLSTIQWVFKAAFSHPPAVQWRVLGISRWFADDQVYFGVLFLTSFQSKIWKNGTSP